MIDVRKVNETKEKILTVIRNAGPSFPTRISREAGISPLFIGALLSEMVAEKKIILSAMRVGSSPLYFMPGQEPQLENFTQYLNSKEKEAVSRLKDAKILDDEQEDPAIRVALRKVRDFAIPLNLRDNGVEKLYWKFFTIPDADVREMLQEKPEPIREERKSVERESVKNLTPVKTAVPEVVQEAPQKKEKKKAGKKESTFALHVKEYLTKRSITLLAEGEPKAKEYNGRVQVQTPLGSQEFLLFAKEKKKLTEDDLALALHRAQTEKMPALVITSGDLDKTASLYLEHWKNLVKVEKLTHE